MTLLLSILMICIGIFFFLFLEKSNNDTSLLIGFCVLLVLIGGGLLLSGYFTLLIYMAYFFISACGLLMTWLFYVNKDYEFIVVTLIGIGFGIFLTLLGIYFLLTL